jgi:predicted nucleic acid-binding protein
MTCMNAAPVLIDTSIFCYAFDAADQKKRAVAKDLLARCWRGEAAYAVSVQNLAEFATIVTEKVAHPLPRATVQDFLTAVLLFEGWQKIGYSGTTIMQALTIQSEHGIHFWDALIVATMLERGISTAYSEDRQLARVPLITVLNPFETGDRAPP